MAANAIDLTLAATVAGDLGIASDATVERVVTAASRLIAGYCGRTFERSSAIVETSAGYGRPRLILSRPPIVSVTTVTIGGEAVDAAEYEVEDAEAGFILRKGSTWPRYGYVPDSVTQRPAEELPSSDGIRVTYAGGYVTPGQVALDAVTYPAATLPQDVQEAAILTAVNLYRARGVDPLVASESLGDWSVSYFAQKADGLAAAIPALARAMLERYVIRRVS